jgi:hypothetical protein
MRYNISPIQVATTSVQVTSGAATALITVPNNASGAVARAVHIATKTAVYILPQLAKFAEGTIDLTGLPANNDTLTVNGTVVTFKTSGAAGSEINIAATAVLMAKAIYDFMFASVDAAIDDARYYYDATASAKQVKVVHRVAGTAGNAFTLAESAANLTISGATLAGGAQTAATAANSILLPAANAIDLWMHPLNAITYIQETSASIVNISPIEVY